MSEKNVLDFLAEVGILKRVKRSGWWMAGIPQEESVAEHSFRCAAIGYVLAKMEKADVYKVLLMTLFNDLHEARINDSHKVAGKYLNVKEAEKGNDSVEKGIDLLKSIKIFTNEENTHLNKELKTYKYKSDSNGKPIEGEYVKINDDVIDATRYAVYSHSKSKIIRIGFVD